MQGDSQDSRFWSRIKTLNARNDVALLDMFNVDKYTAAKASTYSDSDGISIGFQTLVAHTVERISSRFQCFGYADGIL